ncbi:MAG: hypothetical protein P8141_14775, partial [Gammaproteobacteria bacterium]
RNSTITTLPTSPPIMRRNDGYSARPVHSGSPPPAIFWGNPFPEQTLRPSIIKGLGKADSHEITDEVRIATPMAKAGIVSDRGIDDWRVRRFSTGYAWNKPA